MRLEQVIRGAYVADSFDGRELDARFWRPMAKDRGINHIVQDGRLVIAGTTDPGRAARRFYGVDTVDTFPAGAFLAAEA